MKNYKIFDGSQNHTVYSLSDIHAVLWNLLESKGLSDLQIMDVIDNEMWTEYDLHIMHGDVEVKF